MHAVPLPIFYELTMIGIGTTSAPYGLGATSAETTSKDLSALELQNRLIDEAELVPCPRCHWINEELIEGYRRSRYRWAAPLAGCHVLLSLAAAAFYASMQSGPAEFRIVDRS